VRQNLQLTRRARLRLACHSGDYDEEGGQAILTHENIDLKNQIILPEQATLLWAYPLPQAAPQEAFARIDENEKTSCRVRPEGSRKARTRSLQLQRPTKPSLCLSFPDFRARFVFRYRGKKPVFKFSLIGGYSGLAVASDMAVVFHPGRLSIPL
jgi:hypothetical protein